MTNIQAIFSPCHDAFIYYNDDTLICTVCKKVIGKLQEDEEIVTNIEYNVDEDKESIDDIDYLEWQNSLNIANNTKSNYQKILAKFINVIKLSITKNF